MTFNTELDQNKSKKIKSELGKFLLIFTLIFMNNHTNYGQACGKTCGKLQIYCGKLPSICGKELVSIYTLWKTTRLIHSFFHRLKT